MGATMCLRVVSDQSKMGISRGEYRKQTAARISRPAVCHMRPRRLSHASPRGRMWQTARRIGELDFF
ncbi:MAG: hypothetical protein ACOCOQ_06470 [Prevotella sp.]